ncbi:uncharacterized protein LOC108668686 [Hyalella azteca]|uniref:Uncharacterized protein LOC108668686 n=1 Tax=Hyalella azteca TaxID=294128 RepID=A0A8B7NCU9_HYAAZ|nr:uncharacterized protein LOC108668686 [Hyalella azteca]
MQDKKAKRVSFADTKSIREFLSGGGDVSQWHSSYAATVSTSSDSSEATTAAFDASSECGHNEKSNNTETCVVGSPLEQGYEEYAAQGEAFLARFLHEGSTSGAGSPHPVSHDEPAAYESCQLTQTILRDGGHRMTDVDLTCALPTSMDLTCALPTSMELTQAIPTSMELTQAIPTSMELTQAIPTSMDLTQAIPRSMELARYHAHCGPSNIIQCTLPSEYNSTSEPSCDVTSKQKLYAHDLNHLPSGKLKKSTMPEDGDEGLELTAHITGNVVGKNKMPEQYENKELASRAPHHSFQTPEREMSGEDRSVSAAPGNTFEDVPNAPPEFQDDKQMELTFVSRSDLISSSPCESEVSSNKQLTHSSTPSIHALKNGGLTGEQAEPLPSRQFIKSRSKQSLTFPKEKTKDESNGRLTESTQRSFFFASNSEVNSDIMKSRVHRENFSIENQDCPHVVSDVCFSGEEEKVSGKEMTCFSRPDFGSVAGSVEAIGSNLSRTELLREETALGLKPSAEKMSLNTDTENVHKDKNKSLNGGKILQNDTQISLMENYRVDVSCSRNDSQIEILNESKDFINNVTAQLVESDDSFQSPSKLPETSKLPENNCPPEKPGNLVPESEPAERAISFESPASVMSDSLVTPDNLIGANGRTIYELHSPSNGKSISRERQIVPTQDDENPVAEKEIFLHSDCVNTITTEETNTKVSSAVKSAFKAGNELQTQIDKQANYVASSVPKSQQTEARKALSSISSNVDFNPNKSSSKIPTEYSGSTRNFDRTEIASKENQEATADAACNVKKNPSGKTTEKSNKEKREKPTSIPAGCSSCREETIVIRHRSVTLTLQQAPQEALLVCRFAPALRVRLTLQRGTDGHATVTVAQCLTQVAEVKHRLARLAVEVHLDELRQCCGDLQGRRLCDLAAALPPFCCSITAIKDLIAELVALSAQCVITPQDNTRSEDFEEAIKLVDEGPALLTRFVAAAEKCINS